VIKECTSSSGDALDYDTRQRDTNIETNREVALSLAKKMIVTLDSIDSIDSIDSLDLDSLSSASTSTSSAPNPKSKSKVNVNVRFVADADSGEAYVLESTLLRELSFVVSLSQLDK